MTTMTRIYLNPLKRGGRKLLANPQAMHAAVRGAFPPDIDETDGRILWRVTRQGPEHTLYVVGPERPDMHHIVEQAGWMTRPAESADYSSFVSKISKGQKWRFELLANPVSSRSEGAGKRGRIVFHVTADQQLKWLVERSVKDGFVLDRDGEGNLQTRIIERDVLRFRKNNETRQRPVTLHVARFSGILEVVDSEQIRKCLVQGIGRAKAYGCGLVTLAPVSP